jgi:hypothetical protein
LFANEKGHLQMQKVIFLVQEVSQVYAFWRSCLGAMLVVKQLMGLGYRMLAAQAATLSGD